METKVFELGYKDVTHELTQFQRGVLIHHPGNCHYGIMVGGKHDGQTWIRRWDSATMQSEGDPENVYQKTGEIFYKESEFQSAHYIVYRPKTTA